MAKKHTAKKALLTSALAMFVSVAMLLGTTFAWFTDSASTAVNKIQAGTLDVALEMYDGANWVSAEGKTLQFKVNGAIPAAGTQILWEPGCTYELPALRVVNKGNLALKYKVIISGIDGDARLNEVIDWTINDAPINLVEMHLAAGTPDSGFVVKGHMQETAGNEYQGLSIDGIGITVIATQDTVESDSIDNQYDTEAVYPVAPVMLNTSSEGLIYAGRDSKLGNMSDSKSPTSSEISIPRGSVSEDTNALFSMELIDTNPDSVTYEISLKDQNGNSITLANKATVTANIGTNLINVSVKHSGVLMDSADYSYDRNTGVLTISTASFSPFEISYEFDGVASLNGTAFPSLQAAIHAAESGDTVVLLKDVTSAYTIINLYTDVDTDITVDLSGHTITYTGSDYAVQSVDTGAKLTVKNGTINSLNTYGPVVFYGAEINLVDVDINCYSCGVYLYDQSTANLNNVNITCNSYGVYADTNSVFDLKHSTLDVSGKYGVCLYDQSTANLDDVTITCTIYGVYTKNESNANLKNSKISVSEKFGVYLYTLCSADLENVTIDTARHGVYAYDRSTANLDTVTINSAIYGVYALYDSTANMNTVTVNSPSTAICGYVRSTVDMTNVTVNDTGEPVDESAIYIYDRTTLKMDYCNIKSRNIGVYGDGSGNNISIDHSEIKSYLFGVYQRGSAGGNTYEIKNTAITNTFGAGVYISNSVENVKQTLTVNNCTVSGGSGIEMKHTNATITDSVLIGTATPLSAVINGSGSCTTGYALAVSTNGEADLATGTVNVSGCRFYSGTATEGQPNGYTFVYQVKEGSSVTIDGEAVTDFGVYNGEFGA